MTRSARPEGLPSNTPSQTPTCDALVLDFDGTLTRIDVGDALCERFADPRWRELDRAWERGELSLPEAQRAMWATVRGTPEEILGFARQVGELRDGVDDFLAACARRGIELVLASGGFDFYIDAILGPARLARFARRLCNTASLHDGGVEVAFPLAGEHGCPRCAVCKGRAVDALRTPGRRVGFIGDGSSDRCAIGRADTTFAVRGSKLAATCLEVGAPVVEFESFEEILR